MYPVEFLFPFGLVVAAILFALICPIRMTITPKSVSVKLWRKQS